MQAGRRAVFLRFAGCNLWTGREQDRATARLQFLRHRFRRHGRREWWPLRGRGAGRQGRRRSGARAIGGWSSSPAASRCSSSMRALIDALHARGFEIAVETNGTLPAPDGIDWLCVSPKAGHRGGAALGRRAQAGLAAIRYRPGRARRLGFRPFPDPADGLRRRARPRSTSRSPSSWPIRAGSSVFRPTSCWDCPDRGGRRVPSVPSRPGSSRAGHSRTASFRGRSSRCNRGSG